MRRGQISFEYLIVVVFVSFLVLAMLGVGYVYSVSVKERIRFNQIDSYADNVISSAEGVYYSGNPSRMQVKVYLPSGVKAVYITDNNLIFNVSTSSGVSSAAYTSKVPIYGNLSNVFGTRKISVIAGTDSVKLEEA